MKLGIAENPPKELGMNEQQVYKWSSEHQTTDTNDIRDSGFN